jgi:hypothetical protein
MFIVQTVCVPDNILAVPNSVAVQTCLKDIYFSTAVTSPQGRKTNRTYFGAVQNGHLVMV